jgi:hypothetical protein
MSTETIPTIPSKRPLEAESQELELTIRVAKRRLRPHGSYNAEFWTEAAKVEDLMVKRSEMDREVSLSRFAGPEAAWKETEEAKGIFQRIQAHTLQRRICSEKVDKLANTSNKRSLRASFMKLFTTAKMGLGIKNTGAGKRDREVQNEFRQQLIKVYDCKEPNEDGLWCPILRRYCPSRDMIAGHLFASMHGQDTMDAIFGKTKSPELFSPCNGLLIHYSVEDYIDSGKFVIVPDLPDSPTKMDLTSWVRREPREYKIRILDKNWSKLNKKVLIYNDMTWADLDNKRLEFRTLFRPRARYLYFLYCIQVLRYTWQLEDATEEAAVLRNEAGKPFWPTAGRYINRRMLLAFIEELGHQDYYEILQGASCQGGGDSCLLLDVASRQVVVRDEQQKKKRDLEGISDDESEDEDENEDEGDIGIDDD